MWTGLEARSVHTGVETHVLVVWVLVQLLLLSPLVLLLLPLTGRVSFKG